jgi:hypothetical protein
MAAGIRRRTRAALVRSRLSGPPSRAGHTDGMAVFHAGGSLDALVDPYLCAHGPLANAFRLVDWRGRSA